MAGKVGARRATTAVHSTPGSKAPRTVAQHEPTAATYIIDTSAWARLPQPAVRARIEQAHDEGQVVLATPVVLEMGYAAPDPRAWDALHTTLRAFPVLVPSELTHTTAVDLQGALWHSGKVRAAGSFDTLMAALAIEHGATILHYDTDYEHLATIDPRLAHEWVVPRGSVA